MESIHDSHHEQAPAEGVGGPAAGTATPPHADNPSSSFPGRYDTPAPCDDDPAASLNLRAHRAEDFGVVRDGPPRPPAAPAVSLTYWRLSGGGTSSDPSPHPIPSLEPEAETFDPDVARNGHAVPAANGDVSGILDGLNADSVNGSASASRHPAAPNGSANGSAGANGSSNGRSPAGSSASASAPVHRGLRRPPSLDDPAIDSLEPVDRTDSYERPRTPDSVAAASTIQKPLPTPFPEDSLGPQFAIRRLVGEGGGGEVWEAKQEALGRLVAIKRLRRHFYKKYAAEPLVIQRREMEFRQEAVLSARLDHPNIVPVYDLGADHRGRPLMAMKLVKGTPWSDRLATDFHRLSVPEYLATHLPILIDLAHAVAFAHSRGIIHRDIKPSQVMTGQFGEVLLMDWGMALFVGSETTALELASLGPLPVDLPTIDSASNPSGTPAFMAPEQTDEDARRIGPWTDVYLLGGTLYYLLTGTYPHNARTSKDAMEMAQTGRLDPPQERQPGREMPEDLVALVLRAMAPDPKDRIGSATTFVEALKDFLTGASRQREAGALVETIRERLREPEKLDYKALAALASDLDRVLLLWPSQPGLEQLRAEVATRHARQALAKGDLALARAQALVIPPSTTLASRRAELLEAADRREATIRRTARQQRLFLALSIILLLCLAAGAAGFGLVQSGLNRRLAASHRALDERSRDLARALAEADLALAESERLRGAADGFVVAFMEDVYPMMAVSETTERFADAIALSLDYLEALPDEMLTPRRRRHLAVALHARASTLARIGKFDDAVAAIRRHVDVTKQMFADPRYVPADDEWPTTWQVREAEGRVGEVLATAGRNEAALLAYHPPYQSILDELAAIPSSRRPHPVLAHRARLERRMANVLVELGRYGDAVARTASAAKTFRQLRTAMPDDFPTFVDFAASQQDLALTLRFVGEPEVGVLAAHVSIAAFERMAAAHPNNRVVAADTARAYHALGVALADESICRPAEALPHLVEAERRYRDLMRSDPEWQLPHLNALHALTTQAWATAQLGGREADVVDLAHEALRLAEGLPPLPEVQLGRLRAHAWRGWALGHLGVAESALADLAAAIEIGRAGVASTDSHMMRAWLVQSLLMRADLLQRVKRAAEADADLAEAEGLVGVIVTAEPIPHHHYGLAWVRVLQGRAEEATAELARLAAWGWRSPILEGLMAKRGIEMPPPATTRWDDEDLERANEQLRRALLIEVVRGGGREATVARHLMERGWREPEFLRLCASIGLHPPEHGAAGVQAEGDGADSPAQALDDEPLDGEGDGAGAGGAISEATP